MVVMQQHSPIVEITLQIAITTLQTMSWIAVAQTNTATGNDDVLIDQENNLAVTQITSANNNCDSTA